MKCKSYHLWCEPDKTYDMSTTKILTLENVLTVIFTICIYEEKLEYLKYATGYWRCVNIQFFVLFYK